MIGLIAYDHEYLLESLPSYYEYADEILLGLDKRRRSWTGNEFSVAEEFFDHLQALDVSRKVRVVEDSFYQEGRTARWCEQFERNYLSRQVRKGNWLVSLDADEILLNAGEFFDFLGEHEPDERCVMADAVVLFKELADDYLVVGSSGKAFTEPFPVATGRAENFQMGRHTETNRWQSPLVALHKTFARSEDELIQKLRSWAHAEDFAVDSYFKLWQSIDENNFMYVKSLHPLIPSLWPELIKVPKSIVNSRAIPATAPSRVPFHKRLARKLLRTFAD